ncbi:hypothetical protein IPF86_02390 [Candidatus Nomurabacteria bacterium]|jgi:hypothetical protein|nr:MAG: hypothetical protein IPF86_02390 [Candidatus Nomurabacteria bacterium]
MKINIVTDCTGNKQEVIRNIFSEIFKNEAIVISLKKGESFETPLTLEGFPLTVKKRFQWIKKNIDNPDVYIATIQKGYYYSHGLWYLCACVGVAYPLMGLLTAMTSSVPVDQNCSEKKSLDLSKNMSDIIKEEHPDWDKENGSVYELFTAENETLWLEQPLRHCLKFITHRK